MSAAADFDVSSWLNGAGVDKHHHHFPSSSLPSDSFYPTLSIHVPETKTFDHQLGLFSPLIINNESQSMTLQTPTGPPPSGPFLFQNDTIKMENDGNHEQNTTNNLPVFDHGLTINGSTQISSTTAPSTLDPLSSHLSPLSDASSPSDFEVDRYHPISPLSPSISGNGDNHDYQSVDQLFDDDEQPSPATSPDSPASSEISAFSDFARTNNPNTSDAPSTISTTTDKNQQPKSTKSMNGGKKKRTKRRNLLNALKEHLASTNNHSGGSNGEEGTSESDSELMHELTNRSTRTRGKRSASSVAADGGDGGDDDKDDPNSKRERNKQSASAYRKRRKMYLDTLENKVEVLNDKLTEQQQAMAKMENENKVLREQVSFLKRLISFKTANSEEETKETDDSSMHISSSSSSSYSSGGFGATNSRLNLLNYSTAGTKNAGMFLFLLFSCFLLFNPMWSNDLSITTNDGSSVEPVGRMSRKLLSYEDFNDPLHAAPSIKKEDYMQQYFYGFSTQSTDTIIHPELSAPSSSAAAPSKNNQSTTDSVSSSPSSSSSSSSSSSRYPLTDVSDEARSKALAELHSLAASFHMDPQSQQFAELVAASYLPLVNILGEAATRAALQELATGVFFLQHQTMLTAITAASDNKRNNSTSVLQ